MKWARPASGGLLGWKKKGLLCRRRDLGEKQKGPPAGRQDLGQ